MTITQIDFAILDALYNLLHCKFCDFFFTTITHFGDAGVFWILLSLLLIFSKKTRRFGLVMLITMGVCFISYDLVIKNLVGRLRPYQQNPMFQIIIPEPHGSSFPSGHSAISFCAATLHFLFRKECEYARKYWIPATVLAVLIMISRLYLYVHFPSDVLCGALLGIILGICGYKITRRK